MLGTPDGKENMFLVTVVYLLLCQSFAFTCILCYNFPSLMVHSLCYTHGLKLTCVFVCSTMLFERSSTPQHRVDLLGQSPETRTWLGSLS